MNGILERTLGVLEYLAAHNEGSPMASIADALGIPRSAAHRLLADLVRTGYVRQSREHGDYLLTTKLIALGLNYLSSSGIVDIAQPILDALAAQSGELVRLSIIDGDRITWVAKSQGARSGLRYDPDMGMTAQLSCTATGHAWMLTLTDDDALQRVARQGFGSPAKFGPNAPTSVKAFLKMLHAARAQRYAMIDEVFAEGMTAMAAPVLRGDAALGVVSIAGPKLRLSVARMKKLGPALLRAAEELAAMGAASTHFRDRPLGRS